MYRAGKLMTIANDNQGNVIILDIVTRHDIPANRVLTKSMSADLEGAVVMGWTKDGNVYFASSYADGGDVLWLMELLKKRLFEE